MLYIYTQMLIYRLLLSLRGNGTEIILVQAKEIPETDLGELRVLLASIWENVKKQSRS